LEAEINELRQSVKAITEDVDSSNKSADPTEDAYYKIMSKFMEKANADFAKLDTKYTEMLTLYKETLTLFGEDFAKTNTEEFFGLFKTFASNVEKFVNEIRKEREQKEKKRDKEPTPEVKKQVRPSRLGVPDISEAGGDQKGVMDSLLESLKKGDAIDKQNRRERRIRSTSINDKAKEVLAQVNGM
jgi:predicted  nucleic acid-binding Zn-ribbon protein